MLTKLMRYDFRAVLKLWWIPAVTLLALSPLTGLFIYLVSFADTNAVATLTLTIIMILLLLLYILTFAAHIILTLFFCHRRFYCHFFTDEGYLTFTLPVRRRTLLLSKTLVTFIMTVATVLVCAASLALLAVSSGYGSDVAHWIGNQMRSFLGDDGFAVNATVIIILLLLFLLWLCSTQFLIQFAITLGAVIAKKHKILAAIGLYYLASNVLGLLMTLFMEFTTVFTAVAAVRFSDMSTARFDVISMLLMFMDILFLAMLDTILYLLTLSSIERRLNLA